MLYKFKSKATSDLIMLEPHGRQLLKIVGKGDEAFLLKGILLPPNIPAAITALEAAIAQDDAARKKRAQEAADAGESPSLQEGVSLHQRATPFIDMLRRCHKADKEVVWGV